MRSSRALATPQATTPIAIGLRAARGGGLAVGVALHDREPRVVLSTFVATGVEGDRLSLEPYHLAAERFRGGMDAESPELAALVAEGRARQGELAAKGLGELVRTLRERSTVPVGVGLLVNRATWITDVLGYSLAWSEHVPIAEALAVRDALRVGCAARGLPVSEVDEKSVAEIAAKELARTPAGLDATLKALGASAGKPWRKEQKLACLAAWLTLARRG